jgi:hypothetical protein
VPVIAFAKAPVDASANIIAAVMIDFFICVILFGFVVMPMKLLAPERRR